MADSEAPATPPAPAPAPLAPAHHGGGHLIRWIGLAIAVVLILVFGVPWVLHVLNTVSTDDAYVNGHVTFVAPRVGGQVAKVLVDDNNRVHKGDLLLQLDKEPYQVQVNIAKAALAAAQADMVMAQVQVRSQEGQTRSLRYNLEHAIEQVDDQVALLHSKVAVLGSKQAEVAKAQADYDRAVPLLKSGAVAKEDFDTRTEALAVSKAAVEESLQGVYQIRVALGLPPKPPEGEDLTSVPADLDQTFSSVRQAQASLIQGAAQLGVNTSFSSSPRQMVTDFYKRDPQGDINRIYAQILREAPSIKQAEAKLAEAQRNLDQAELNLRYCDVISEIDGVVTRRDVNPGNNVIPGQSLMAVRSVTEIWVDANFKETQLGDLRIGQAVDLDVDMYGSHQQFKGRISGFTMGTGSTLALLPPENATGNFVKVVQRLPVRIELIDYDPDKVPLFIGLSVTPSVLIHEAATGDNAGKLLQPYMMTAAEQTSVTSSASTEPSADARIGPRNATVTSVALSLPRPADCQPEYRRAGRRDPHLYGGAGYDDRQRRPAVYGRRLSAPVTDSEWVITSYLAANAIILPISGWLGTRLGRRNYFLLSIALFTFASAMCGMAQSLNMLIASRVLQGLAGGGLQPSSQGILLDAFPAEKQGKAMTIFGIAALLRRSLARRWADSSPTTTAGAGSFISMFPSGFSRW